jgi:hypothetical protein
MTDIEVLRKEIECVKRADAGECNRDCARCELVMDSERIIEAYRNAIYAIKRTTITVEVSVSDMPEVTNKLEKYIARHKKITKAKAWKKQTRRKGKRA